MGKPANTSSRGAATSKTTKTAVVAGKGKPAAAKGKLPIRNIGKAPTAAAATGKKKAAPARKPANRSTAMGLNKGAAAEG
jgi:hypothetical protein